MLSRYHHNGKLHSRCIFVISDFWFWCPNGEFQHRRVSPQRLTNERNTLLLTEPGEPYDILVEGVGFELKYLLVGGGGSGNSAGAGSGYLIYNNFVLVEDCTMVTALVGDQGQHSSLSFNKCGYQ